MVDSSTYLDIGSSDPAALREIKVRADKELETGIPMCDKQHK